MVCDAWGMNDLAAHYALLLGLDESWQVVDVELALEEQKVEIRLSRTMQHREQNRCPPFLSRNSGPRYSNRLQC